MRILFWTPLFWPETGGIEVMAQKMVTGLRQRGHQLLVLASHGSMPQPDDTSYEGIAVRRLPFWQALTRRDPGLIVSVRRRVTALMNDFQPDVIHANFSGYTAYFLLDSAAACRAPLLLALHSSLKGKRAGAGTVLGDLLRAASWVAAVSQSTLDDARSLAGDICERSSVIYNGQAPGAAIPAPLPWNEPRLMTVGRLAPEKGFDLGITALALLRERCPRLTLQLVGDGPERGVLQKQADDLGLGNAVEFTGNVPNWRIPDLLNHATVVLIPSRCLESFSLVAVEAAMMGRPVVATAAGGLSEVVLERETGLLVEMENAQALAAGAGTLLADPELAEQMGANGRKRALALFSLERMIRDYEALYLRLASLNQRASTFEASP